MDFLLNVTFVWAIRLLVFPLVTSKALNLTTTLVDRQCIYFNLLHLWLLGPRIGEFIVRHLIVRDTNFLRFKQSCRWIRIHPFTLTGDLEIEKLCLSLD